MIGFISGEVVFSDGNEVVVLTTSGVGYQLYFHRVLAEGSRATLYVSHVVKENSEELFAFEHLRAKKLFEMLLLVRGVGPKSAYSLMSSLLSHEIIEAIQTENKKLLTKAQGVGDKAASQMILDLSKKIHKIKMFSSRPKMVVANRFEIPTEVVAAQDVLLNEVFAEEAATDEGHKILEEALLACRELGFKDEKVIPLAQKYLSSGQVNRPEQLVHLVLREI